MTRTVVLALLIATSAHANVWTDAAKSDAGRELYDHEMAAGDELARDANSPTISTGEAGRFIASSIKAYRAAAQARPEAGEPYYRIGRLLYSFYFECDGFTEQLQHPPLAGCPQESGMDLFHPQQAQQIIDAWDAFEARAPLDPRLGPAGLSSSANIGAADEDILFRRAILHTKFATHDHLVRAAHDYEEIIALSDPSDVSDTVLNNLAETYMMLGRLDESIAIYGEALRRSPRPEVSLGLAVALDRAGRADDAREEVLSIGIEGINEFVRSVDGYHTFFVPEGEKFYYFALIAEATGSYDRAVGLWREYIRSGAHPEFQPRAKQHIATLLAAPKTIPRDAPYREVPP